MSIQDLLPTIRPVVAEFDRLGISYYIGGSVASSLYGEPRSTLDVDIGAAIPMGAVEELVSKWEADFYVSESAMREAIQREGCFNLIHFKTMLKVDVFVCGADQFNASVLLRRLSRSIAVGEMTQTVCFATPEDVLLHKLVWYRKGGEASERQWRDLVGIIQQQQDRLDMEYLNVWSERLHVRDLWERLRTTA